MKNVFEGSKKKVVGIVAAGVVGLSIVAGAAYADKDEWTQKIQDGIHYAVTNIIFKGEIDATIAQEKKDKEDSLKASADGLINGIYHDLLQFKQEEINRGKNAIDAEYTKDVEHITRVANNAKEQEKADQRAKTNKAIQDTKNSLDAIVDSYLNQVPNQGK